ncbi:DUF4253 domain-containing protein [Archangium violaceum]|uniref:DUF4253 domain-containing protein n=1 Tax=Archangium violaceum TaxID=83451 RepID=UPI0037BF4787
MSGPLPYLAPVRSCPERAPAPDEIRSAAMKWLVLGVLCLALVACETLQSTRTKDVIGLNSTSLSPEARAVASALTAYCQKHQLELKQVLAGLRSALHLAANDRIGFYPDNRHGSGDDEQAGEVFATDELAVESIQLGPGKPGYFSSDSIAIDRILVAKAQPTDPQLHIPLDQALALAGGSGIEEGQRIRLPFTQSAPSVFARAFSEKDIYPRASLLCGVAPEQLEEALEVAILTEARRFVHRKNLFASRLELEAGWVVVEHVSDPTIELSVADARAQFSNDEIVAGDVLVVPVEIAKEWPSFAAPLLELIDAAGLTANSRRLGDFDFGALVARRKLDAMPAAPEALVSRLRRFGIAHAWRLFNEDGPEVYRTAVASKDAFNVWRNLSEAASELGYLPVVLGSDRAVEDVAAHWTTRLEQNKNRPQEEHYLNKKPGEEVTWYGLRQDRFVSNTPQEVLGHLGRLDPVKLLNGQDSPYRELKPPHGKWPATPMKVTDKPELVTGDWTHIALVPARQPWEVPAFLPFFSGEGYPDQAELVAVARYYHERYGARVFGMNSGAELELWVPQPLSSKEDALAVAAQHFFLCPDGVVKTVETHAARLMQTHFWWFWWD